METEDPLPDLELTPNTDGGVATLAVAGEIDIATAPALDAALAELEGDRPPTLVIDLAGVRFLDSTGLRSLLSARRRADEDGRRLRLANIPPDVNRVFDVTGARPMFDIEPPA